MDNKALRIFFLTLLAVSTNGAAQGRATYPENKELLLGRYAGKELVINRITPNFAVMYDISSFKIYGHDFTIDKHTRYYGKSGMAHYSQITTENVNCRDGFISNSSLGFYATYSLDMQVEFKAPSLPESKEPLGRFEQDTCSLLSDTGFKSAGLSQHEGLKHYKSAMLEFSVNMFELAPPNVFAIPDLISNPLGVAQGNEAILTPIGKLLKEKNTNID
ncbi:hypothetical protein [Salinivibrio sp. SS2]|uniref:hypothetical protein n=1 Tax=Salinivibrio sp. SS2 TaxID=1892894 RepID=UPI00084C210B|nr:hypothetical protein [Salinivibrio sp. DV]ODQ01504.1 hypothetical protein BGK46_02270 [Salinivibrio sp. DV]